MLQPLVIGLGRSGAGLHVKALARLAALSEDPPVTGRLIACDPRPRAGDGLTGVTVTRSLAEAARLVDPPATVVHVCTPPRARAPVLAELARLGFRTFLVEKPLAADRAALDAIDRLRRQYGLDLVVMSHWLAAGLTHRLRRLVEERPHGALRHIAFAQHKPRFLKSLAEDGHPTAFDVEIPHSLGVVLDLAGPADLVDAHWSDLTCEGGVRRRLGGARLTLRHHSGVRTEIVSDLASPVQQRSITMRFEQATVVGHYPLSEQDDHAQLVLPDDPHRPRVFRDDALTAFIRQTYEDFAAGRRHDATLPYDVVRLLCAAKDHCLAAEGPTTAPDAPTTEEPHAR
ncbi:hypothetical protein [Streptomyces ochraceiscleroticus]|uniref:Gfo/Idh/MocA-like oxidoreductase N-terminal domain-containing protein n=1 Tax=Streptomyces ochraceiscleroticus TaxID=47761 RepID=A0ABW1MHS6_9ACTN|nr:hypothetical protein [Streptomyces ochraceiscleroticus]